MDPHLFPFSWEKTRLLRDGRVRLEDCVARCGEGDIAKTPPEEDCNEPDYVKYRNDMAFSRRFQWLPFDVNFDGQGTSRYLCRYRQSDVAMADVQTPHRITSYINNVHPMTNHALYYVVENLIDAFVPLFDRSIIDLKAPGYREQRIHLVEFGRNPFIKRDPTTFRPPEQRANANFVDDTGRYQRFMFVDLKKEFWNTGLQMVSHLQDINLSSEHPEYEGQEWHVQGQTVCNLHSLQTIFVLAYN